MDKRKSNLMLMAQWSLAWKTLGRWQSLNARLSREAMPDAGWARRAALKRPGTELRA